MYPGTIFNIIDNSALNTAQEPVVVDNSPRFMVVSSFDKGPEDLREVRGDQFVKLYGIPSFAKHGQNGIQAKHIIDCGGTLLVKRVCADDATLANIVICANVTTIEEQKTDANGNPIYIDAEGAETTEVTEFPLMITKAGVKWTASSIEGATSFDTVKNAAEAMLDETNGVYPLFIYTDIGRGMSAKAARLIPDYSTSRTIGQMYYNLKIYEGTEDIESQMCTFNPDIVYNGEAYGIDRSTCQQVSSLVIGTVYDAYVAKLSDIIGMTEEVLSTYDTVYGYDFKGNPIPGFVLDQEGVDLNTAYGIELVSGTNGAFGDNPVGTTAWEQAIKAVFDGEVTDEVWDLDAHPLTAVVDANLPISVKNSIATFVQWRKDCEFLRDYGTGLTTYTDIIDMHTQLHNAAASCYVADYMTSYTIKDPVTKKNIEVTMLYDFVECLINHYNAGNIAAPLAGIYNDFILRNAIKGTINFTPIITPAVNQKAIFEELRINYAIFQTEQAVVQSCFTTQDKDTELSYVNNIMLVEEIIRAIRIYCPRIRFQLGSGTDLSNYAEKVNNLLEQYKGRFYRLNFIYTQDKLKAAQKIFYGSLEVAFDQWSQAEIFDVFVLNSGNLE